MIPEDSLGFPAISCKNDGKSWNWRVWGALVRVWASLGRLGASLEHLWGVLGRLRGVLGRVWGVLGRYWGVQGVHFGPPWPPMATILAPFWRPWSPIWPPLARGREMSPKFLDFRSPLDFILAPKSIKKPAFISMKIRPVFY